MYKCDVCGKSYVRKALFKKHIQTKHVESLKKPVDTAQMMQLIVPEAEVVINHGDNEVSREETTIVVQEIGPQNVIIPMKT